MRRPGAHPGPASQCQPSPTAATAVPITPADAAVAGSRANLACHQA